MKKNINDSKFGIYNKCDKYKPIKKSIDNFEITPITNICEVFIVNIHAIDVAESFCEKGENMGLLNGEKPVLMCVVGKEFYGHNFIKSEDIKDDIYNLRTNFNSTIYESHNPYPIKNNECVYNKVVTVITDNKYNFLKLQEIYQFGLIIVASIYKPELLNNKKMKSTDFINTLISIENLFQIAILNEHNILILTPFGQNEDEMPQEDIIKIYNFCICKYGHMIKNIIIAVPKWDGKELFDLYNKNIIKPQDITKEIDDIYIRKQRNIISKNNKLNI